MNLITDTSFSEALKSFPSIIKQAFGEIRDLVHQVAREEQTIAEVHEVLRWGQLSFVSDTGSTFRMGWHEKEPSFLRLYFQCTSRLIPVFRSVFGKQLVYESNRALVFKIEEPLPKEILIEVIRAALLYHKVKNHPSLGL